MNNSEWFIQLECVLERFESKVPSCNVIRKSVVGDNANSVHDNSMRKGNPLDRVILPPE